MSRALAPAHSDHSESYKSGPVKLLQISTFLQSSLHIDDMPQRTLFMHNDMHNDMSKTKISELKICLHTFSKHYNGSFNAFKFDK